MASERGMFITLENGSWCSNIMDMMLGHITPWEYRFLFAILVIDISLRNQDFLLTESDVSN